MLTCIFEQSWVANSADYIRHMEGVTHLLNASAGEEWDGKFEKLLRFHLTIPAVRLILTSLDQKVHPTDRFRSMLNRH